MTTQEQGRIIHEWWKSALADRQSGAARGLAARIRRGTDVEIIAEPVVQQLAARLGTHDADRLIRLVRVMAELREGGATSLPRLLGGAEPVLSNARFQALMRAEDEQLTALLIRAIRALPSGDRGCAIAALGRDLWVWNDKVRIRWSFDYFAAPVPEALELKEIQQ